MRSILYSCAFLCLFLTISLAVDAQCLPSTEVCDGKDNDCDGLIDEGFTPTTWYRDFDGDGYGSNDTWHDPIVSCTQPESYVSNNQDCSDYNSTIYPGAPEICDRADNDCNGLEDDGINVAMYYTDRDGDGYGEEPGYLLTECEAAVSYPITNVGGDCDDNNPNSNPAAPEICDGLDNDCNGEVDEGFKNEEGYNPVIWYPDQDGDSYGNAQSNTIRSCTQPQGYVANDLDCHDYDATVYPGAPEICDFQDNNCNGSVDEGMPTSVYYADHDQDGYGAGSAVELTACQAANTWSVSKANGDCDDQNASINPSVTEVCDGKDNDCDGTVDEGFKDIEGYNPIPWYPDQDGDGYGNGYDYTIIHSCTQPEGYVANNLDCNDYDRTIYPGAPELCDHQDNDCNGLSDEGLPKKLYYRDSDGDGYGEEPGYEYTECEAVGWPWVSLITVGGDCNDSDPASNPAALEVCDGVDNNCNGQVDEGFSPQYKIYLDADGDGYGNDQMAVALCDPDKIWEGYVRVGGDCSDWNAEAHPGAVEVCDDLDNNCDGQIDEGFPKKLYYIDNDRDGYGVEAYGWLTECQAANYEQFTLQNGDCDDGDAAISPLATEVCDGIDNNCDGQVDEGFNPTVTYYFDGDLDGFGDNNYTRKLCSPLLHFVAVGGDCYDGDATVYPGAPELCDGRDNNCDGQADEGLGEVKIYYWDRDGDGYGLDYPIPLNECQKSQDNLNRFSLQNGDCRDMDPASHPGATEVCDGIDNNCNGVIDEGCPTSLLIIDDLYLVESEAYAELTVRISKPSNKKISVSYTTVEGSAKSKVAKGTIADFVEQKGKVTIPAGALSATIRIPLLNDGIVDGDKQFYVQLSKPHNAELFKGNAYVYIWDANTYYLSKSAAVLDMQVEAAQLTAKVFPNPSNTHFTIKTQGKAGEQISVRIVDVMGRIVEVRSNLAANGSLTLGHSYRPGMYYAEIVQGGEKVTLKLVKQ